MAKNLAWRKEPGCTSSLMTGEASQCKRLYASGLRKEARRKASQAVGGEGVHKAVHTDGGPERGLAREASRDDNWGEAGEVTHMFVLTSLFLTSDENNLFARK